MQQQIGGFQFLKGGLKSFGQFLWEVADKSDRIRQHKFVLFGEAEPPGVVGSSVANSLSSASTSERVRALRSVDFPALV